ncbi:tetratricopeptide repeat protein [Pararhodospirillum oryzae]|uniref:Uncharacterized protein n=1 Tax=Pararhodospirillum oryzae TaxID=478448 RepID=A0A512H843_9PROT|nr:tetratricopeptide repeat protein [Pararhodospirillum oryzae]GEO81614.1 hypothetical protein ROR02_17450 [Pararhodospirillum oryzae]
MGAVEVLVARADALAGGGALAEACDVYRVALDRDPRHGPALAGLGRALLGRGAPASAACVLRLAAAAAPERLDVTADLALALARSGDAAGALAVALEMPPTAGVLGFRAERLEELGRRDEALAGLTAARLLHPHEAALHRCHAVLARRAGQNDVAAAAWRALLAVDSGDARAWSSLGGVLEALGEENEAREAMRVALALDPSLADSLYNWAHVLIGRDQLEEALPWSRRAARLAPACGYIQTNLGVCLLGLGRVDAAVAAHRRAVALDPGDAEAAYDLAWALLTAGDWGAGWRFHEARWRLARFTSPRPPLPMPAWDGRPLPGNATLFLHAEQGLGDALMMARLIAPARARARARRVVVECPAPLARVMGAVEGVDEVLARGAPVPPADAHLPLMSLPHRLGVTLDVLPGAVPWIHLPGEQPPAPAALPVPDALRVGLVWAGSPDNAMDRWRSCPAGALGPLLAVPGIHWVNLQLGPRARDLPGLPPALAEGGDLAETARTLATLDLVVGVDTAVIHLAGALGRPAWVLLAFAADFRWLRAGETSPWYPSLRLFRQTSRGDWPGLIDQVAETLAAARHARLEQGREMW